MKMLSRIFFEDLFVIKIKCSVQFNVVPFCDFAHVQISCCPKSHTRGGFVLKKNFIIEFQLKF